jgi:ATP-dependent protease ClpP protease subunit
MIKFSRRSGRSLMTADPTDNSQVGVGSSELEAIMGILEDAGGGPSANSPFEQNKGVEQDENRVYFYTPVTETTVLELTKILRSLDIEMQCLALRLKTGKIPIEIHIHSPGGDLFSGLAAVDVIQSLKSPVHTYVEGSAASAATLMSIAGDKRYMYKNSFMLIHQISSLMVHGTHEQFKDEFENQTKLMDIIKDLYLEKTTMNEEQIDELLLHDLWLDSGTCLTNGLVDKIL